jgi:hypothetical protein
VYNGIKGLPGDDVTPNRFVTFWCDGSRGLYIHPTIGTSARPRDSGQSASTPRTGRSLLPRELRQGRCRTRSDDAGADQARLCRSAFECQFRLRQASGRGGAEFAAALHEHAVLVRHFNKPRTAPYLRITVGTEDDTRRLIAAAVDILGAE